MLCRAAFVSHEHSLYHRSANSAKEGRVGQSEIHRLCAGGISAIILDDVVTDGASKIAPFMEAGIMGLNVGGLVVLVDRQQGWEGKIRRKRHSASVWPGMTCMT
jgi:orotate phosphoribosyltransferase